jgi:hypothetical protein
MARVMTSDAEPLTGVRKTVPSGVEAAVLQALAKLPADRFATAREFGQALRGEGTAPTSARPTTASSAARSQAGWRVATGVCAMLAAVAEVGWWQATRNAGTRDAEMTRFTIERPEGSQFLATFSSLDARTLFFTDWAGSSSLSRLMAYDLAHDSVVDLGLPGSMVLGQHDDLLLYINEGNDLYGVRYDLATSTRQGAPRLLSDAVASDAGVPVVALADDGSLVYRLGTGRNSVVVRDADDANAAAIRDGAVAPRWRQRHRRRGGVPRRAVAA